MRLSKKNVISFVCALVIAAGIFSYPMLSKTKEERVLDKAMGEYKAVEWLGRANSQLFPRVMGEEGEESYANPQLTCVMKKDKTIIRYQNSEASVKTAKSEPPLKYSVVPVDEAFVQNSLGQQGTALRAGGIRLSEDDLKKHKNYYAVFNYEPTAEPYPVFYDMDKLAFYNFDGSYYGVISQDVYRLEKVK